MRRTARLAPSPTPSRNAPLSRTPPPRSRSLSSSSPQSAASIDRLGCGARDIVPRLKKFVHDFHILSNSFRGIPDLRRVLVAPVVVAFDGRAVARQVQRDAGLPVRVEHGGDAAAALGPERYLERRVAFGVPQARRGRRLRIARAVEAQRELLAVVRGDADQDSGPLHREQPPALPRLAGEKAPGLQIGPQRLLVGRHQPAPWMRGFGTRSKAIAQAGHAASVPMCTSTSGWSFVPAICRISSAASSFGMPSSLAAQFF